MTKKISLKTKNWAIKMEHRQKEIILKETPNCVLCGRKANVIDHLFSRTKRRLFFYRDNLNPLCSPCHVNKTFNNSDASAQLFFKTRARIGETKWQKLLDILCIKKPFDKWNNILWREEVTNSLTKGKYYEYRED